MNLSKVGTQSKIERFVRPKKPLRPSKKTNIFALLKDDVQFEDPSRVIARAIRAIIGAVYYDGGMAAAKRVMASLMLTIKLPE